MTKTYAILEVSHSTYYEIRKKLIDAGYSHLFIDEDTTSMQGLALRLEQQEQHDAEHL